MFTFILRVVSAMAGVITHSMVRPNRIDARHVYLKLGRRHIGNYRDQLNERTLRQILVILELAGYKAVIRARWDRSTYVFATMLKYHPNIRFLWRDPEDYPLPLVWTDQSETLDPPASVKTISVQYDYKPGLQLGQGQFAMPYGMHPSIYTVYHSHRDLKDFREQPRRARVLFAGLTHYDGELPATLFGKVLRSEIIERLRSSDLVRVVTSMEEMNGILDRGYWKGMLLFTNPTIPQKDWLNFVASADFFLCPPGTMMPMCHNIIESMSVGTIPITNYPEWFLPALSDMKNCVVFSTIEDLVSKLEFVVDLDDGEIRRLRSEVIRYYSDHLSPDKWFGMAMKDPRPSIDVHVLDETEQSLRSLAKSLRTSSNNSLSEARNA